MFLWFLLLITKTAQATEKIDSLQQVLRSPLAPSQEVSARLEMARLLSKVSPDSAFQQAELAVAISKGQNDLLQMAYGQKLQGLARFHQNNHLAALSHFHDALALFRSENQPDEVCRSLNNLALSHKALGNYKQAQLYLEGAIAVAQSGTDTIRLGELHNKMGSVLRQLGEGSKALDAYLKSHHLFQEVNHLVGQQRVLNNLGNLYFSLGNFEQASTYYQRCIELNTQLQDSLGIARTWNHLSYVYLQQGDLKKAAHLLSQALRFNRKLANPIPLAHTHSSLAYLKELEGQFDSTLYHHQQAYILRKSVGDLPRISSSLNNIGNAYLNLNNFKLAEDYFKRALHLSDSLKLTTRTITILENLSEVNALQDDFEQALTFEKRAGSLRDSLNQVNIREQAKRIEQVFEAKRMEEEVFRLKQEAKLLGSKNQTKQAVLTAILAVLLAGMLVVLFAWYRPREKTRRDRLRHETANLERKRIGHELHDNMGAIFMQIGLYFEGIEEQVIKAYPGLQNSFDKTNTLLSKAANMIRQVTHDLSSETLANQGLLAALQELQDSINQRDDLEMNTLAVGFEDKIPGPIGLTIHQCVRELVNNAVKHAGASVIEVVLVNRDHEIEVRVEDNGSGINQESEAFRNGIGLNNIRSRLKHLSGTFALQTSSDGTVITLLIPLKK